MLAGDGPPKGTMLPLRPSRFGSVHEPVRELRDPAVHEENGKLYLLYSGTGESIICGAELMETESRQPAGAGNA